MFKNPGGISWQMKKLLMLVLVVLFAGVAFAYTEQGALDKIDWSSINDGTIVLLSNEWNFNNIPFIDFNPFVKDNSWQAFVPSKEELVKFLQRYDFEIVPMEKDGKKVFVIKEVKKRDLPLPGAFNLLPSEVQDAAMNLTRQYSFSTIGGGSVSGSGLMYTPEPT